MGDSLDFLGIDLYLVVSYHTTNCIPISLTVSIFPDSPIPRFPDSLIPRFPILVIAGLLHTRSFGSLSSCRKTQKIKESNSESLSSGSFCTTLTTQRTYCEPGLNDLPKRCQAIPKIGKTFQSRFFVSIFLNSERLLQRNFKFNASQKMLKEYKFVLHLQKERGCAPFHPSLLIQKLFAREHKAWFSLNRNSSPML